MFYKPSKLKKGFSLIEILVVIAIIGILTSILAVNYNQARQNSRDKIRKSDLKTVQLALEVYKSQNGRYPAAGCGAVNGYTPAFAGPGPHTFGWGVQCDDNYIVGLAPDYIAKLPEDPSRENEDSVGYIYTTDTLGTAYKLIAHKSVESNFITSYTDEFARCPAEIGFCTSVAAIQDAYAVYSPGAEGW